MKILILSDEFPPESLGGSGVIAYWQAGELARRGHTVTVITATRRSERAGERHKEGMHIHTIYTKRSPRFRAYYSLYNPDTIGTIERIIREVGPDVVHAHNVHQYLSYHSLEIARRYAKKVILTAHDVMSVHYSKIFPSMTVTSMGERIFDYRVSALSQFRYFWREWNPVRNIIIKRYLKNVDHIFAVSEALAEALRQNGIENVDVMHNGIDAHGFSASETDVERFREKFKLRDKIVLLFGGRVSRAKGGDVALELLVRLHEENPRICLIVAGREDSYVQSLKTRAYDAGVLDSFVVVGWLGRDEMRAAYGAASAVLTLSLYMDPFPTVNLEAMAAGKPVLGTCYGGTPEAVEDGVTGRVVDPFDTEEVVRGARETLLQSDIMGRKGRKRVEVEFSLKHQVDTLETAYGMMARNA